jgi:hypothetical protein
MENWRRYVMSEALDPKQRYLYLTNMIEHPNTPPHEKANAERSLENLKNKYPNIDFEPKEEDVADETWWPLRPTEPPPATKKPKWWDRRYETEPHFASWVDKITSHSLEPLDPYRSHSSPDQWKQDVREYSETYVDPIIELLNSKGAHINLVDDRGSKVSQLTADGNTYSVKVPVNYWPVKRDGSVALDWWRSSRRGQDMPTIPTPDEVLLFFLENQLTDLYYEVEELFDPEYKVLFERYAGNAEWNKIVDKVRKKLEKRANSPRFAERLKVAIEDGWGDRFLRGTWGSKVTHARETLKALEKLNL